MVVTDFEEDRYGFPLAVYPTPEDVPLKLWDTFGAGDIPDDIAAILQAMGTTDDDNAYRTGDIVGEMLAWAEAERIEIPLMRLYAAVGYWRGKTAETIRTYWYVVKNVPEEVRYYLKHDPELESICFGQVKSLVPICKQDTEAYIVKLHAWLDHCAEYAMGHSSVDGMRRWLKEEHGDVSLAINRARRMISAAERLANDEEVPLTLRQSVQNFLTDWKHRIGQWGLDEWRL